MFSSTAHQRFWKYLDRRGDDECWAWKSAHSTHGYGILSDTRLTCLYAHRLAYQLLVGPIPDDLHVLHTCDNRGCLNPKHLFLGTQVDNNKDRHMKGRSSRGEALSLLSRGERNGWSKLTDVEVTSIRSDAARGVSIQAQMQKYNLSHGCIWGIRKYKSWKHLP